MADQERTCDKCGKTFKSDGAWYARHAMSCTGAPAKSGRIAQPASADRTPPAAKTHPKPRRVVQRRKTKSKRAVLPARKAARRSPVKASPYAAAIAELEGQRARHLTGADRCSKAIEALEAMG